jgi:amino acid adenylation domain-containing protein
MKQVAALMAELQARDVMLRLEDGQLTYDAPDGALTDADLARIRAHKADLIDLLQGFHRDSSLPIEPADRAQPLALSAAQQRLWFVQQLEGMGAAYNIQDALRLNGPLERSALEAALEGVVARHEILRTTFHSVDGEPVQVIAPHGRFPMELSDVGAYAPSARQEAVQHLAAADARAPFDLGQGPLARARLVRLADQEHVLLLTLHHLVADGWSLGVLIRELATLYEARVDGRVSALAPLSLQYVDYAQWQRRQFGSATLQRQREYWSAQLAGAPALLELPSDRPRPPKQSYVGESLPLTLSAESSAALKALARRHDVTLFMALYTGFVTLLARLSGQSDVVVGIPVACRPRADLEPLIGFFVNNLAVRVRLDDDPPVSVLLQRVKESLLAAYANQDLPFAEVIEALRPPRSLGHSPVFQVLFAFQNTPQAGLHLGSTLSFQETGEYVAGGIDSARFDLTLALEETQGQIAGALNYASDLFDRATVVRWMRGFQLVLDGLSSSAADRRLSELPLLDATERVRVIETFNATDAAYPADQTIHGLFEAQVARTPGTLAVAFEHQHLTYAELNRRANRLARHLRMLGVGLDQPVAVCLERSLDLVVALLGVLKAGGAYVPIDPNQPSARIAYMLRATAARVLLTQARFETEGRWPAGTCVTVALDRQASEIEAHADDDLRLPGVTPRQLAYVIYTSGSTGQPKGVMNEHGGVVNRLHWMQERYRLDSRDRVLQKTHFGFDVSVWEFFWPLLCGARLVVARPGGHQDPLYLGRLIREAGVSVVHFVPSMLSAFLDEHSSRQCTGLRLVVCSGEELTPGLRERCLELLPQAALHNLYGPTEAAIDVTSWDCRAQQGAGRVPIGHPIANLRLYVLDSAGQPVPVGVPGEIHIGGVGVARGYLGQPELTAACFIPDRLGADAGARLYRTGDWGRWRADGALEYLGRNDHQVKIRGLRIELGEIEARLARHPQVKDVVVVAREGGASSKQLVAYLTCHLPPPSLDALRAFVGAHLPDYMVPAAFVLLEALPLTPNGKLDRRALPMPDVSAQLSDRYVAPRDAVEEALSHIWAQVLGVRQVGVDDDFFALGGDSILSLRILDRARAAGFGFALEDLFRHPTVARLAQSLLEGRTTSSGRRAAAAFELLSEAERNQFQQTPDIEDAYPLSALQAGMHFHSELHRDSAVYHDIFSLCIDGPFQRRFFERALVALTERHPILRTSFHTSTGNRLVQTVHRSVRVSLEVHDVARASDVEEEQLVARFMEQEKWRRFSWSQAPLFRVVVHLRARTRFQYSLSFHHAILDGWSLATFQTELFEHYLSLLDGREAAPTPPASLYRDYIALEQEALQSAASREFWRQSLADAAVLALPVREDHDAQDKGLRVATYDTTFTHDLYQQLGARARELGVSLKTLLFVTHVKVMSLASGQRDVLTGLVSNGRIDEQDGDLALGLYLNSLPFRVQLREGTWRELARQLHELEQEMLPHRRYPLQAIQAFTGGDALVNTLFNFVHFHVYQRLFDAGMVKVPRTRVFEQTNFDLMVVFSEDVTGAGISLQLAYDPAVLASVQVQRLAQYYQAALVALAEHVDAAHDSVLLLSPAEVRQLESWNATAADYPRARHVHELVEEQVRRSPGALALRDEHSALTYAELDSRANRLARHLRRQGVGPDRLVALSVHRRADAVVAMLATLKAGGAYVALDPTYPSERLAFMLEDARPAIIVTHEDLLPTLPPGATPRLALDAHWHEVMAYEDGAIDPRAIGLTPHNLAYVIYTSGSTGRPKGVMIEHASVTNFLAWGGTAFSVDELRRTLFSTSINFDLSVFELFVPLTTGGTVQPVENVLDQADAVREVTLINTVPSAMATLLDAQRVPASARVVNLAGEALGRELVERIFAALPVAYVANLYGPTETTTYSTHVRMARPFGGEPHIGAPIANTYVRVLDAARQLVPPGVPGEICIGGIGVTRGYLNRPDLTAERFVPDPYGDEPGARLYRTGDLGRWASAGHLQYLGRQDQQVKIRGFRIELGEVEAHLRSHPQVREAVVLARDSEALGNHLVAYVQAHESRAFDRPEERFQVETWQTVFDGEYAPTGEAGDARDNFSVWVSSYDGAPLPLEQMRAWADLAAERIGRLRTETVLELGCGVGLVLLRLLPNCTRYVGTDFSQRALDTLASRLPADDVGRVELLCGDAGDAGLLAGRYFDTTVLNSVVQYFPSRDYLAEVLEAAVARTRAGGAVFVGDIRNHALLEAFTTSLVVHRAASEEPLDVLRQRIRSQVAAEGELLVAPEWFIALLDRLERVSHVEVLPKLTAPWSNELFDYRYDVVLHVERDASDATPRQLHWTRDKLDVGALREYLERERPALLRVAGIPNERLQMTQRWQRLLREADRKLTTVAALREAANDPAHDGTTTPRIAELLEVGRDLGYLIEPSWLLGGLDGEYALAFSAAGVPPPTPAAELRGMQVGVRQLTNDPLVNRRNAQLTAQLRAHAQAGLPTHMHPTHYLFLDALPLTLNGKLDRRALAAMEIGGAAGSLRAASPDGDDGTPRGDIEQALAAIWRELLGLERVGRHDNFFDLGGHSLLAVQVTYRIYVMLGWEVEVSALFEYPTIQALACQFQSGGVATRAPIERVERDRPLPLSAAQRRLWVLAEAYGSPVVHQVAHAVRLLGPLDRDALQAALDSIVARHEVLRTVYDASSGTPMQVILPTAAFPLELSDLSTLGEDEREAEIQRQAGAETRTPFDLAHGPVIRGRLLRLASDQHVFLFTAHSIVYDGWSRGVLLRELGALYTAYHDGRPDPLAPLPIQYADYAAWQADWLHKVLDTGLDHWWRHLGDATLRLELPCDRPRPSVRSFAGDAVTLLLDEQLSSGLKALAARNDATLYMTMFAGWALLLSRLSGQDDVVVGTLVANREAGEVEGLIGAFVNFVPMRVRLDEDASVTELLQQAKTVAKAAYAHQWVPFMEIVDALQPPGDPSRHPIFQVTLMLENTPPTALRLPAITFAPQELPRGAAEFDLSLSIKEKGACIDGLLAYSTDLFERTTVEGWIEYFKLILTHMVRDPGSRLNALPWPQNVSARR